MHKIRLNNAVFFAHHGITDSEKETGGKFGVDVEVQFDFESAAKDDDLDQTLCYEAMYQAIQSTVKDQTFDLIETIAYLIADQILKLSAQIEHIEVTVRKLNPPIDGIVDSAEVLYYRKRS